MTVLDPLYGNFQNGVPYVRFGTGEKKLVIFSGGPGNTVPRGKVFETVTQGWMPLVDEYTISLVTRKPNLPQGYSTIDMAADYAEMIRSDFDGHVDVVVGVSYGGLIAQHFAAEYPELFDHLAIAMAAHKIDPDGLAIDMRFAELLSQGKDRQAWAAIAEALYPRGVVKYLGRLFMWLIGPRLAGEKSETYPQDILVEATAERDHQSIESLKRINSPVLIITGENDPYFPVSYVQEMADIIPDATLIVYEDREHNVIGDSRFADDLLDFINPDSPQETSQDAIDI